MKPTIPSLSAHYCTAVAQGHEGELIEELAASKKESTCSCVLPLKEQFPQEMCHQNEAGAGALNAAAFLNVTS